MAVINISQKIFSYSENQAILQIISNIYINFLAHGNHLNYLFQWSNNTLQQPEDVTGTRSIISLGFNQIEQLSKYITDKRWFDTNSLTLLEA